MKAEVIINTIITVAGGFAANLGKAVAVDTL